MRDPRLDDPGFMLLRNGPVTRYRDLAVLDRHIEALKSVGYEVFVFDCTEWPDRESMHAQFAAKLNFPDYYGRNLDALNDCLCNDLDFESCTGIVIVFRSFDALAHQTAPGDHPLGFVLLDILASVAWFQLVYGNRLLTLVQQSSDWPIYQPIGSTWALLNSDEQWSVGEVAARQAATDAAEQ